MGGVLIQHGLSPVATCGMTGNARLWIGLQHMHAHMLQYLLHMDFTMQRCAALC